MDSGLQRTGRQCKPLTCGGSSAYGDSMTELHTTTDMQTMVRTEAVINGTSFLMAQGQDLDELKGRIESAVHSGGRFVEFVVVGNREVSVLISAATHMVFSVQTVQFDPRDTGDHEQPFGGMFDLEGISLDGEGFEL